MMALNGFRANASAGEQGHLDDLDKVQQAIEARDRANLPVARRLSLGAYKVEGFKVYV